MSRYVMKLPDLGEGTVAAEVVAWKVAVGDRVVEDQPLAEMATDKAVVEVPSPVSGRIVALAGAPGDSIAVGAELVVFERGEADGAAAGGSAAATPGVAAAAPPVPAVPGLPAALAAAPPGRVRASPATRRRARESGVELGALAGSGPGGRILRADLDAALEPHHVHGPARALEAHHRVVDLGRAHREEGDRLHAPRERIQLPMRARQRRRESRQLRPR